MSSLKSAPARKHDKRSGRLLKAVGAITAVISLLLVLNQVTGLVQTFRIHHKEFSEAMKSGEQQQEREDYPAAFDSFKRAVDLDPIDREAQAREAQAAMLWLDNVHAQKRSFTETANQLLPVLDNALTRAKGPAAADLLAHIGWANFLRYRDGVREGVTVDENFRKALKEDPSNVYAHAMWGFWVLWQAGSLQEANQHFSAALASGRLRLYARDIQVSALLNTPRPDTDMELLRVASEMRKHGEPMEPEQRHRIFWEDFTSKLHRHDELVQSLSVLPPDDTEATYDWLDPGSDCAVCKRQTRDFIVANQREIAGNRTEALSRYVALQKELKGTDRTLIWSVNAAIKRLSAR